MVQITARPSQLVIANFVGGLFSFFGQKSASKALKTLKTKHTSQANGGLEPDLRGKGVKLVKKLKH